MAFDRVLPNSIANVNERFHSPLNATIITGVFALFGVISETLGDYGSGTIAGILGGSASPLYSFFLNGVGNTDLFDAVFFSFFALSLVLLPLRKSRANIYESAPVKYGGKTGMVTIGVIGVLANLILDYMIVSAEYSTAYTLVVFGVIGAIIYAYYKYGKKDVDYSTIFAQIPPE
jgi:amino acid transporter